MDYSSDEIKKIEQVEDKLDGFGSNHCGGKWVLHRGVRICNYCGSLHPKEAIKFLTTPGTAFSGSDWKYGWPHKFYIEPKGGHFKFYNKHLDDISNERFNEFSELSIKVFGIQWGVDSKGIYFKAPKSNSPYGYQLDGVIGEDGAVIHRRG